MRKPFTWLLAMAGTITIAFAACSKDDDKQQPDNSVIAGTWHFEVGIDSLFNKEHQLVSVDTLDVENADSVYITFQQDGKFSSNLNDTTVSGVYTLVNATTLELSNNGSVPQQVNIVTLNSTELVLSSTDTDFGNGNYSKEYFYLKK
jgi:hypothetical protein